MKASPGILPLAGLVLLTLVPHPVQAGLIINPNFASNITSDANAAAIEGVINSAIALYEATFSDPITVDITFEEGGGLGESTFNLYSFSYKSFYDALVADGKSADDATALARLAVDGAGTNNPVTGTDQIWIKAPEAHALGLNCSSSGCDAQEGGLIDLQTAVTDPGSTGSSLTFALLPVVEHEIDEILGLGSTLGLFDPASPNSSLPSPEDFFRFTAGGARSFTPDGGATAFFSIDGTTDLQQFNQQSTGDYGDWASSGTAFVQDAFGTPEGTAGYAIPAPGVELRALDVIGYDLAPEPGTFVLLGSGLLLAGFARRRSQQRGN